MELAEAIGDREASLHARTWLVLDLVESGDLDAAREAIDEYARLAEPLRIPAFAWWVPAWRAMLAVLEGRFDEARRLADESLAIGEPAGEANARIYWQLLGWCADYEQRRPLDRWLPALEAGIVRGHAAGAFRCAVAKLHAASGRLDEARRTLEGLGRGERDNLRRDMNWYSGAVQYAVAVGELRDADRARVAYSALLPYAGRNALTARAGIVWGPIDLFLGRLAATAGLAEEAERHYDAAVAAAERMRSPTLAVRAKEWYAALLRDRGGDGDAARAVELERQAAEEAARIGIELAPVAGVSGSAA